MVVALMPNFIQHIRDRLQRQSAATLDTPSYHWEESSPCGRYQLIVDEFAIPDNSTTSDLVVATIQLRGTNEVVAQIMRNDSRLFYAWVTRDDHDYFLFPEDLEGQSVVDLTERQIAGFAEKDGGFIWTEFHPSPDKSKLAIIGCCWACPYQVLVYDFRDPMSLPLPILAEFSLPGSNAQFGAWSSNESFTLIDDQKVSHVFKMQ